MSQIVVTRRSKYAGNRLFPCNAATYFARHIHAARPTNRTLNNCLQNEILLIRFNHVIVL